MLKNYFITAWRNFRRNKIFSFINVLGLAIGISAALVIFLIVHYDFSFDKFENGGDRIYRVVTEMKSAGNPLSLEGVPSPLPDAVKKEVSGLEETVGFQQYNGLPKVSIPINNGQKPAVYKNQLDVIYADNHYFKIIPYQWLAGSPITALTEPHKLVLTEQRARTYFPDKNIADIIGKQIIYDDSIKLTVSGIVKNLTENTDFKFKEFASISTIYDGGVAGLKGNYAWGEWGSINGASQLFIKLAAGSSVQNIESQLKTLLKKYNKDANRDNRNTTVFRLQPLDDLHFNSAYGNFNGQVAHKPTLYALLIVAVFLLLLGCINFINLSTAQASKRAKEIGIRKTMGSSRKGIVLQFLNETFFITLIATILSILITPLLLKVFSDFIPKDLHLDLWHQPYLIIFLIGLVIVVSLLSGFYPAMVLSRYNPALVLKNQAWAGTSRTRKAMLRKSLTIFQFFIAQVFVMATLVTVKQIHYVLNKDMGFKKDAIIFVWMPFNWSNFSKPDNNRSILMNKLESLPGIQMISLGSSAPSSSNWSSNLLSFKDGKKEIQTDARVKYGDTNFLSLYRIKLLAGRNVQPSDTTKEWIVNETYMHQLGFQNPGEVLNKQINGFPVVAVMADFNQESLHAPVKPLAFSANTQNSYVLHIALSPQNDEGTSWETTIGKIKIAFKAIYPQEDFNYEFFDESIAKYYKSEEDISRLLKWATGLAIFISCMGLLGLVIFTTNLRTKEIGVRKVLGASVSQIVSILSKDFVSLVLIAFVIAMPLAWWAMHTWLENFAYRTTINWWVFLLSGAIMMVIALITLSIQTIRAASANPVESLRNE
jgi:ABC-type antimicrobial peptide transport system permease subunit